MKCEKCIWLNFPKLAIVKDKIDKIIGNTAESISWCFMNNINLLWIFRYQNSYLAKQLIFMEQFSFLSTWFCFTDTEDSRYRWGMERPIFIPLYHFPVPTDIQILIIFNCSALIYLTITGLDLFTSGN